MRISQQMIELARSAERAHGDGWAILLEPHVGDAASPIYTYCDGAVEQTPYQQATHAAAEERAMKGMCGIIIISSYWDDGEQTYVAEMAEIENDDDEE